MPWRLVTADSGPVRPPIIGVGEVSGRWFVQKVAGNGLAGSPGFVVRERMDYSLSIRSSERQ